MTVPPTRRSNDSQKSTIHAFTSCGSPNSGTAAARNAALQQARGRYIAFLDADDRWFPEKIATELAILERCTEPAIAYSCHYAVDDAGRLLHAAGLRTHSGRVFDLLIDGEDFLMPSLCLFDRRIFERVGTFAPTCFHEDYEFVLRATRHFSICPSGQRLAVYRQTTSGKCRSILSDYEFALAEELGVAEELAPALSGDEFNRLRRNVLRGLYLRFLMYGFPRHARRLLGRGTLKRLTRRCEGVPRPALCEDGTEPDRSGTDFSARPQSHYRSGPVAARTRPPRTGLVL